MPKEPHNSQCVPAFDALPLPASTPSVLDDDAVLTTHTPPSLPVRTSSASMDAGATSAENRARKLRKAANLAHRDGRLRDDGVVNTGGL